MRHWDWLLIGTVLLPPAMSYMHGRWALKQEGSGERIAALMATYALTLLLPLPPAIFADLPGRLEAATGLAGTFMLVLCLPIWLLQFGLILSGYHLDRIDQDQPAPFRIYCRTAAGGPLLMAAWMLPIAAGVPLLSGLVRRWPDLGRLLESSRWASVPVVAVLAGLACFCLWGVTRWLDRDCLSAAPEAAGPTAAESGPWPPG